MTNDRTKYLCEVTRQESQHTIHGVPGKRMNLVRHQSTEPNQRIRNQKWVSARRTIPKSGGEQLSVSIRHDDELLNGHASFSITGTIYDKHGRDIGGGCVHEEIAKTFPELAPLIKWHLCSTDGPMHYIANTTYLAGDRDCHGQRAGELSYDHELTARNEEHRASLDRKITHGLDIPAQYDFEERYRRPDEGQEHTDGAPRRWLPLSMIDPQTSLENIVTKALHPVHRTGEGKPRELDAARRAAIWPEATDDQLCADRKTLTETLQARLTALLAEFRTAVEAIGFDYE